MFTSGNDSAGGFALDHVSVVESGVTPPTPVPAPAGLLLGLVGVAVIARVRRRVA